MTHGVRAVITNKLTGAQVGLDLNPPNFHVGMWNTTWVGITLAMQVVKAEDLNSIFSDTTFQICDEDGWAMGTFYRRELQ